VHVFMDVNLSAVAGGVDIDADVPVFVARSRGRRRGRRPHGYNAYEFSVSLAVQDMREGGEGEAVSIPWSMSR
jgi:hypothetical protein